LLLNVNLDFVPDVKNNKIELILATDSQNTSNHPLMQQLQQLQQVAAATVKTEQSKLLPEIVAGINNTSIKGTGADDKVYGSGYRFTSVQAGVSIPIFSKSQKAKIEAAKFNTKIVANNYQVELQIFRMNIKVHCCVIKNINKQLVISKKQVLKQPCRLRLLQINNLQVALSIILNGCNL